MKQIRIKLIWYNQALLTGYTKLEGVTGKAYYNNFKSSVIQYLEEIKYANR